MKRIVAGVILLAFTLNCTSRLRHVPYDKPERLYPIVISERVGDVIDAEEREQFGLFPGIEEFKEAQFYAITGGGYEVQIATETEILVSANHDRDAVVILREYIDEHEEIERNRTTWETRWGVIDYDALGVPITENEVNFAKGQVGSRACATGILSCVSIAGVGAVLGIVMAATMGDASNEESYYPIYAVGAGVLIGLITGAILYFRTLSNVTVLEAIKEARQPRVLK